MTSAPPPYPPYRRDDEDDPGESSEATDWDSVDWDSTTDFRFTDTETDTEVVESTTATLFPDNPTWSPPPPAYDIYTDCLALRDLYQSAGGANWTSNAGWPTLLGANLTMMVDDGDGDGVNGSPCCFDPGALYGVQCDENSGRITGINIASNNLNGTLPTSLQTLTQLVSFKISGNKLLSGPLPPNLLSIKTLTSVSVHDNSLSGSLPSGLQSLSRNFSMLNFESNKFTGPLPAPNVIPSGTCDFRHNHFTCIDPSFPRSACDFDAVLVTCGSNGTSPIPPGKVSAGPLGATNAPTLAVGDGQGAGAKTGQLSTGLLVLVLSVTALLTLMAATFGIVACLAARRRSMQAKAIKEAKQNLSERFGGGEEEGGAYWVASTMPQKGVEDEEVGVPRAVSEMPSPIVCAVRWWEQELQVDKVLRDQAMRKEPQCGLYDEGDGVERTGEDEDEIVVVDDDEGRMPKFRRSSGGSNTVVDGRTSRPASTLHEVGATESAPPQQPAAEGLTWVRSVTAPDMRQYGIAVRKSSDAACSVVVGPATGRSLSAGATINWDAAVADIEAMLAEQLEVERGMT
ncbi:hypothetical protein HK101_009461 [Irineochytrium annulatum]|nr:hypothetical protein HK101_009461 [Irineochytrium annulatum]